jgi:HTH-type transcriptional regulator / antitoxin HigA
VVVVTPLAQVVLDELRSQGLTQRELAIRIGYSEKHVSGVLRGYAGMSPVMALDMADSLGLDAAELLRLQNEQLLADARSARV